MGHVLDLSLMKLKLKFKFPAEMQLMIRGSQQTMALTQDWVSIIALPAPNVTSITIQKKPSG
jgi:putative lipoic acid-binding regulatory protein